MTDSIGKLAVGMVGYDVMASAAKAIGNKASVIYQLNILSSAEQENLDAADEAKMWVDANGYSARDAINDGKIKGIENSSGNVTFRIEDPAIGPFKYHPENAERKPSSYKDFLAQQKQNQGFESLLDSIKSKEEGAYFEDGAVIHEQNYLRPRNWGIAETDKTSKELYAGIKDYLENVPASERDEVSKALKVFAGPDAAEDIKEMWAASTEADKKKHWLAFSGPEGTGNGHMDDFQFNTCYANNFPNRIPGTAGINPDTKVPDSLPNLGKPVAALFQGASADDLHTAFGKENVPYLEATVAANRFGLGEIANRFRADLDNHVAGYIKSIPAEQKEEMQKVWGKLFGEGSDPQRYVEENFLSPAKKQITDVAQWVVGPEAAEAIGKVLNNGQKLVSSQQMYDAFDGKFIEDGIKVQSNCHITGGEAVDLSCVFTSHPVNMAQPKDPKSPTP